MSLVLPEEKERASDEHAPDKSRAHDSMHAQTTAEPLEKDRRIPTPLKIAIGSSFILRLAGASTGFLLGVYLKQVVQADANVIGFLAGIFYITELLLAPVFGALSD